METVSCCSLPTPSHHPRVGILWFPRQRVEMPQRDRAAFRWGARQMELVRNKDGARGGRPPPQPSFCGVVLVKGGGEGSRKHQDELWG